MKISIMPYKKGSKSAKSIYKNMQEFSPIPVKYAWRKCKVIINWGNSNFQPLPYQLVLNRPEYLLNTINKLKFFQKCIEFELPVPKFTTNYNDALRQHKETKGTVERHLLTSSKGRGVVVIKKDEQINPDAKMWVERVRSRREFRFIIVGNEVVVSMVKKRPRGIAPQPIQNEKSGYKYFYTTEHEECLYPLEEGHQIAINTIKKFNLDFGGVDIMWDKKHERWLLLEVNTAFGLGENNGEIISKKLFNLILRKLEV